MIRKFRLKNFKSYLDTDLPIAPLTVMIGANASGKSNAIEGLRLLSWVAQGNRLGTVRYAVLEQQHAIRGRIRDLAFRNADHFSLGVETVYQAEDDSLNDLLHWESYEISLERRMEEDLHIKDERLTSASTAVPLFEVVAHGQGSGNDLRVAYNNFAKGGRKPQITCSDQMSVLAQVQSSARFEKGHAKAQKSIPSTADWYLKLFSNMVFLDPSPSAMRDYSFTSDMRLMENGGNLSAILFNLCQDQQIKAKILNFIKSLPEQDIQDIQFIETPRNEAMVTLTETFGGQEIDYDATILSDGTLRVLSVIAAILSAPKGSLVVIEEIDNGVHPSRASQILSQISEIAKNRNLGILISSHNPALLDALPKEAVPDVVFCYRDLDRGDSRLISLKDVPKYPELMAQGSVGHLMTRGVIERFVKNKATSSYMSDRFESWLASLEK
jgi:predicted ATPase